MNNKSQIALFINGRKVYTRNVMPSKKYTHALINDRMPTSILSCSSNGTFDKSALTHRAYYAPTVVPVTWTGARTAEIKLLMTANDLGDAISDAENWAEEYELRNPGYESPNKKQIALLEELREEAIEAEVQRFAGQCREMIRKIGYLQVMELMSEAKDAQ